MAVPSRKPNFGGNLENVGSLTQAQLQAGCCLCQTLTVKNGLVAEISGGMVPASKYVMQGQLLGAINKEILFVFVDKLTNFPARSCVLCVCFNTERNAMYYFNTERNAVYCVLCIIRIFIYFL